MLPFINNQAFSKPIQFGAVSRQTPCGTKLRHGCNQTLRCSLALVATRHKRPKFNVNGHLIQTPTDALRITAAARLQAAEQLALVYGQSAITPSSVRPVANSPARLRAGVLNIALFDAACDNHPLAQAANQPTSETRMESEASTSALSPCQSETFPPLPQRASNGASQTQGMPPQ